MTSAEMGRSHLAQARRILAEAGRYHADGDWHLVVRRGQESVELALKAVLRYVGIEVPHVHDVGAIVAEHSERLPAAMRGEVERLVSISRRLRREREISFYGDDELSTPPERLYSRADAETALHDAAFVVDLAGTHFGP